MVLDIDLLRTFHTVARLGRFKDAATHLGKSTSAVSVHIQRLEHMVGVRLFERDNQRSELSARGRQLIAETTGLLVEHDKVVAVLTNGPVTGKLRLGIPEEYAGSFLKQCLPLFAMENPGIELEVEAASSGALAASFAKGRLDATVTVAAEGAKGAGAVLSGIHPVWAVGRETRALSHSVIPVALHAEGCPYRTMAIEALNRSGRSWRVILTSGSSTAISAAVESGLVVAVTTRSMLAAMTIEAPKEFGLPELSPCDLLYHGQDGTEAGNRLGHAIKRYFTVSQGSYRQDHGTLRSPIPFPHPL